MDKTRTSKKQQTYSETLRGIDLTKIPGIRRANPLKHLTDPKLTGLSILECLLNNDPEGVMEMIEIYLHAVNKKKLLKKTKMPKSTMYSALKHRNPTIKTLCKIMYNATH